MIEFVCIGLDIRTVSATRGISADATVWEQEENLYERAQGELGINENAFQLLHPNGNKEMSGLVDLVTTEIGATLISLWLPRVVFESCPQAKGYFFPINLSGYMWNSLGFDVCDINGFFSYLDMSSTVDSPIKVFEQGELMDAFAMAQAANFIIREHSPFVVVELKSAIV